LELPQPAEASEEKADYFQRVEADALLTSDCGLVVGRVSRPIWDGGQVIVVANGSFLLNLPLVNHEHRKLAGRLIQECGPRGQTVVFLESGPGGVSISDRDTEMHHLVRAFTQWPVNGILFHLTMLGIVYCVFAFPIFGRPRELVSDSPSDFGKHIDALGGLLERTADLAYARARLAHYQKTLRRDPGTTPFQPPEADSADTTVLNSKSRQTSNFEAAEAASAGGTT
jgi:hypothetical protein